MQFQVPQFIEVEDRIFGPLTFRQFVYLGGGAGFSYILFRVLPLFVAVPFILIAAALALALAFMKINGRPFNLALEYAFYFIIHSRLYLWNNERKPITKRAAVAVAKGAEVYVPKLSESRLHDLAWSLDIKERIAAGSADETDRARADSMRPIITARDALVR
ncbi:MAG TPA: PrgI family protein [Candidatus Paceibacterota bacterium]|nr:PrgI family protein [Candidatus Paceibacterota bacterium]